MQISWGEIYRNGHQLYWYHPSDLFWWELGEASMTLPTLLGYMCTYDRNKSPQPRWLTIRQLKGLKKVTAQSAVDSGENATQVQKDT
jgi:hypothetical protein